MHIKKDIPSSTRIVGEQIRIWYVDQPLTCRKCGGSDHLAGGCSNPRCFNCEGPGHRAHQCPQPPMCAVCRSTDHHAAVCPFLTFSGNIEETGTPVSYAAAVIDEPPPQPSGGEKPAPVVPAAAAPAPRGPDRRPEQSPRKSTEKPSKRDKQKDERRKKEERNTDNVHRRHDREHNQDTDTDSDLSEVECRHRDRSSRPGARPSDDSGDAEWKGVSSRRGRKKR